MKLPLTAVISVKKIKEYLLSLREKNDKSIWLARAGYHLKNWQLLEQNLRTQILSLDAVPLDETEYGQMFEIKGVLTGPNGNTLDVCTIWMIEHQYKYTKFITMFPDQK